MLKAVKVVTRFTKGLSLGQNSGVNISFVVALKTKKLHYLTNVFVKSFTMICSTVPLESFLCGVGNPLDTTPSLRQVRNSGHELSNAGSPNQRVLAQVDVYQPTLLT